MFKNETVVKGLLFTLAALVLSAHSPLWAQGNQPAAPNSQNQFAGAFGNRCSAQVEYLRFLNTEVPKDTAAIDATKKSLQKCFAGDNDGSCQNASKEYRDAAFGATQCQGFGKDSDADNIGCGHAVQRCMCLDMDDSAKNNIPVCSGVPGRNSGGSDLNTRMRACPEEAAKDIEKLEAEEDKLKKSVRELEGKLAEKRKSHKQDNKQANEKEGQIRKEMAEAAKKHGDDMIQHKREWEKLRNEFKKQEFELLEELARIADKERKNNDKRREADLVYNNAATDVNLMCSQRAEAEVAKLIEVETAKLVSRVRNLGGFNSIMAQVNRPERQQWQEVTSDRYNKCMRTKQARIQLNRAFKARTAALKAVDEEDRKLEDERANVKRRIGAIRGGGSCSNVDANDHDGSSKESALCEARRQALENALNSDNKYKIDMDRLRADGHQNIRDRIENMDPQGEDMGNAQRDLNDEKARLSDLSALLKMKKDLARGQKMDQKTFNDVIDKVEKLKVAAQTLVNCATDPKLNETPNCNTECDKAARFLKSVGIMTPAQYGALPRSQPTAPPAVNPSGTQNNNLNPPAGSR